MRFGISAQGRDQDRAGRTFRTAENGLVQFHRALVMVELRLEPALEITLFLFIREQGWTRLVENAARPRDIVLFEKQLDRAQLRAIVPLLVAEQLRINLE